MGEQFDVVSFGEQNGRECIMYMRLSDMKVAKKLGKEKPKNVDQLTTDVTEESVTISAMLTEDGRETKYLWEKNHQGKISEAKIKVDRGQLKVTLVKKERQDWPKSFISYLLEL